MNHTAHDIAQQLANQSKEVVRFLLPNGKQVNQQWVVGSIKGEAGESLKVSLSGNKAGLFHDFSTEDSGDLLDLWALNRNVTISEALLQSKRWLGIERTQTLLQGSYKTPELVCHFEKLNPANSAVVNYLTNARKLNMDTLKLFGVGERNNEVVLPFYQNNTLVFVKYLSIKRINGKKQMQSEKGGTPILFGWQALPPRTRRVALTEGELDAMSLHQYGFSALSVPTGAASLKWLDNEYDQLAQFDEIDICFDQDDAGLKGAKTLIERLGPERCRLVELPKKDANECLQTGISQSEINQCFEQAKTCDPDELKAAHIYHDATVKLFYPPEMKPLGLTMPWQKLNDKVLLRPHELSIWSGINGHGKSQLIGQLILHAMSEGQRVCVASLELKPERLLQRLARQASAIVQPSLSYLQAISNWYKDKLWLFELVGTAKSNRLLEVFDYARRRYGIEMFVIDSLMKLDIAEDDYNAQKSFIEKLCDFKNQHPCHVHLIVHPRKGADENKAPNKLDFKGTSAISDLADNCFILWRNKDKEKTVQSMLQQNKALSNETINLHDAVLSCEKQRNGEWEGNLGLWFDLKSYQFLNHVNEKPRRYVQYSKLADG